MKRNIRVGSFPLLVVWALFLVAFMILRPRTNGAVFWFMIGAALVAGSGYMMIERRASRRAQEEASAWSAQIIATADVRDFADDGHLYEMLDPDERVRLVEELARMPLGSRSLRRAIEVVCPDLLDEKE